MNEMYVRHALELAILLPAAFAAFAPVKKDLRYSFRRTLLVIVPFLIAFILLGALACVRFVVSTVFILLPMLLLCLEVFFLSVNLSVPKKLFCFLNAAMLCEFSTVYSAYLTAPVEPDEGPFTVRSGLICLGFACFVLLLFYKTLTVKIPYLLHEERLDHSWWIMSAILTGLCVIFYILNPQSMSTIRMGRVRAVGLVGLALYPLFIYALYHLFWWTSVRLNESARIQQENTVLSIEQKRYEELRSYMDETRTLRHDFRQHLRVISELAADNEYDELKEYVGQLADSAPKSYTPYCANPAVDALASHYSSLAEGQKIVMEWNLDLPKDLPVPEFDYCALLGNLLENAVHATAKVAEEKRRIVVFSSMLSDTMLGLTIDNPYTGKVRFNKEHLPVTREPGHGFGMPSVSSTVKRYNGTMEIVAKDGVFSVNVMLYPPQ